MPFSESPNFQIPCQMFYTERVHDDGTVTLEIGCRLFRAQLCPNELLLHTTWPMDPNDPNLPAERARMQGEVINNKPNCPGADLSPLP